MATTKKKTPKSSHGRAVDQITQENVKRVLKLEEATKAKAKWGDRVADTISRFCGSMTFVVIHVLWYGGWIIANLGLEPRLRFDPFPFSLLTLVVSLEAIFLATFILIAQNRQSILSERRAQMDLQIDMLAEQENTKTLELLDKIACKLGIDPCNDPEIRALAEAVTPEHLAKQIEKLSKD